MHTTTATKPATDLQVGDVIVSDHYGRDRTFEVEGVALGVTRAGGFIVTADGFDSIPAGICGPNSRQFAEGECVTVRA